jgi:hypothetical protein
MKKTDLAMQWLIDELEYAAEQAHVLEFSEVWLRYCDLVDNAGIDVPHHTSVGDHPLRKSLNHMLIIFTCQ